MPKDRDRVVRLVLPPEMAEHLLAEAKELSAEVAGPPITTLAEAARAMLLYGLNTSTCQRAYAQAVAQRERRGGPLDS